MRAFRNVDVIALKDREGFAVVSEAGITMGELQNTILARGLTLRVVPGNPAYTVGGCIATGCHNLGQSHAADLLELSVVMHNGTVRNIGRTDPDFAAAAVSMGRLGIILNVTLEVLPYRPLQWYAEQLPVPSTPEIINILEGMTQKQESRETVGNKLVFYIATGVLMMEHWIPLGRSALQHSSEAGPPPAGLPLDPYVNPQSFRIGQGALSIFGAAFRRLVFDVIPKPVLSALQVPAEAAFRGLHTSPLLKHVRSTLGWQHSPENRGEGQDKPRGHQYTWAGWIDEVTNLIMGLRHVEVIFPIEPKDKAAKCLEAVFAHKHLAWWRLNVRTMRSEEFFLSSTHSNDRVTFLRVDFVGPGALIEQNSGGASLTSQLRRNCPGWRKHWGKGLWEHSPDDKWGDPEAFRAVAKRWDPGSKFRPRDFPSWL